MIRRLPAIWFPCLRLNTGVDVFTERLCEGLNSRGIRAQITWLPRRAEFLPWSVPVPTPPAWANVVHVNTWLHRRFVPAGLALVATMHHSVHDPRARAHTGIAQKLYHRLWIRQVESWILHRAAAVTAVSQYTAQKTREHFGVESIRVIYNGMPMPEAEPKLRDDGPHRPFRLLYVGTWSRRKGVDLLGPIMELLGTDFELSYTADSETGSRLPANCRSLGRPDRQRLQQAYLDADALLFPTRLEGFGQVALEAMACGLPVIATNGSALPEVVADGTTGLLCPQDDIAAFAAAARTMARNRELWSVMSRAAFAHARRPEFSLESMVAGYVSVYEQIC